MNHLNAGIGKFQLAELNQRVQKRKWIFEKYIESLQPFSGIDYQHQPPNAQSNRWLSTFLFPIPKELIIQSLADQHIEARPIWKPLHTQPVFKDFPSYRNGISERLFDNGICLPSGNTLTKEEIARVVAVLKSL
jgi:dTDP-4-amino-4,6-dideoxygalactose transaminase